MENKSQEYWQENKESILVTTRELTGVVLDNINEYFDTHQEHAALYSFITVNALSRIICSLSAYNGLTANDLSIGLGEIFEDVIKDMKKTAN